MSVEPLMNETREQPSQYRQLTSYFRMIPNFIIIGAMKAGTSSLYGYLHRHPDVIQPCVKEIHYFSEEFELKVDWYRSHFPMSLRRIKNQKLITGEASTSYLSAPRAAEKVAKIFPDIKLIALLRNPVDRAYSHYAHERRKKRECRSFAEAINQLLDREKKEWGQEQEGNAADSKSLDCVSYISMGIYEQQLKRWFSCFREEQILILRSEDLYSDTAKVYSQVLKFLNLASWEPPSYRVFNSGSYESPIDSQIKNRLLAYYEPHNARLYKYLNRDFGWDS